MKVTRPLVLALALSLFSCAPSAQTSLVGSWHAAPSVSAGFAERYVFRSDGTYTWYAAEASESGPRAASGTWKQGPEGVALSYGRVLGEGPADSSRLVPVGPITAENPSASPYPFKATFDGFPFWKYSDDVEFWEDPFSASLSLEGAVDHARLVAPEGGEWEGQDPQERDGKTYWVIQHFDTIADDEGSHRATRNWYYVDQASGAVFRLNLEDDTLTAVGG